MHYYYGGAVCDSVFAAYVVNMQGQVVTTVSYIDPTVVLFSHHHTSCSSISCNSRLCSLATNNSADVVSVSLLPESQHTPQHKMATETKIFRDTFHGSYKDGTDKSRDYIDQ